MIERFSILVPCVFTEGDVEGEREYIGKVDNEKKCADKVRREKPLATGATWSKKGKGCYADSGRSIKKDELNRSCLFRGKSFKQKLIVIPKIPIILNIGLP